jgi:hypothetical protein
MLPRAFLTDTGWDPFVERKNDGAWGAKPYDCKDKSFWYLVCPFCTDNTKICAERVGGEESEDNNLLGAPIIKSRHDSDGFSKHISTQQDSAYEDKSKPSSVFTTDDLVGRTFVMDQKYGKPVFDCPIKFFKEHQCNINDNLVWLWLLFFIYDYQVEELITYNKFLVYWSKDKDNPIVQKFRHIVSCKGPLKPSQIFLMKLLGLPRQGQSDMIKMFSGYLSNNSDVPNSEGDWPNIIHGEFEELKPDDDPESLGMLVTSTQYLDSNLKHQGQVLWETIETAPFGSVFAAAVNCVKQIIGLPNMPCYLGDPRHDKSHMLGGNKSVVDSSMQVISKIHKQHTKLSIRQAIERFAYKMIGFYVISGDNNPTDILSKHWGYSKVWTRLKGLLFWIG